MSTCASDPRSESSPKAAPLGAAFLFALLCLCVNACTPARLGPPGRTAEDVVTWASSYGLHPLSFPAQRMQIFALLRQPPGAGQNAAQLLTIYLEGDGAPWYSAFHPPEDPTPRFPMALSLAVQDAAAHVLYLARPCQYQDYLHGMPESVATAQQCAPRLWTNGRFSTEVIEAYLQILDALRQRYGYNQFQLIGYSGGGTIAMALGARRADVSAVVTIASPLDVAAWTHLQGLSPLETPAPPSKPNQRELVRKTIHLAGAADTVVPAHLTREFVARHGGIVHIFEDFDHGCCWSQAWPTIRPSLPLQPTLPLH